MQENRQRKGEPAERRIIRKRVVLQRTGYSDATIWRKEKAGQFPERVQHPVLMAWQSAGTKTRSTNGSARAFGDPASNRPRRSEPVPRNETPARSRPMVLTLVPRARQMHQRRLEG